MHLKNSHKKLFFIVIILGFVALLSTHPFLRYPYDMIHHLIIIDDIYLQLLHPLQKVIGIWTNDNYIMIQTKEYESFQLARPRYLWHYLWAEIFTILQIDSTQIILRAKIIHIVQVSISVASIYYFSNVILRNIFKNISISPLRWLSLWSVFIWLTIFATFSATYHQVWIMWYSVNYQITLPIFWYILALTVVLLIEDTSWKIKLFFIFQILLLSRFMLQVHSMEFLYYLMHITIFTLIFIDKIYLFIIRYYYIILPLIVAIIYMFILYLPEKPLIFDYFSLEKLPELYQKIMHEGQILINGFNRAFASINELMYLISILGSFFLVYQFYLYFYKKIQTDINIRMLIYVTLTSLFILIPLYQFSGGLFAVTTYTMVVNRFYYSASLFLILPIVIYGIFAKYKINILYMNLAMILLLTSVSIFSKHNNILQHNYYKNLKSIKNSFNERKVGFNLNQAQINMIKNRLDLYEKNNTSFKEIRYFARADIAFVIKYFFHKEVYWKGRSKDPDYLNSYKKYKYNKKYKNILFKVPKGFPSYRPYT